MSTADIIILILVVLIIGFIIFRMIYKRVKKDYCYDCYSKSSCSLNIDELLKEMDENIKD